MEGIPGSRLAEFLSAHPEIECPPPVEGVWRAWIPGWCATVGRLTWGRTEDELLAKLRAGA